MAGMFQDLLYLNLIGAVRAITAAQGIKIRISGEENVPESGGAVVVVNHTGYLDFIYAGYPFRKFRRYVRYMAKGDVFKHPVAGPLLREMRHIPVDRIDGTAAFDQAVDMLKKGELVGIFPEATISRSFEIKTLRPGAVRMAQAAGVPIIMVMVVGSQRVWTKGQKKNLIHPGSPIHMKVFPAWYPEGDVNEATQELRRRMITGLEEVWSDYQAEEPITPGALWAPARLGGGAPTFDEAQAEDDKVEQERRRVRVLTEEIAQLTERIKQATKADAGKALSVLKDTVDEFVEEVVSSAKEGKDRVMDAGEQLRRSVADLYGQAVTASQVNPVVVQATAQVSMLLDRLPQRKDAPKTELPRVLVLSVDGAVAAYPEVTLSPSVLSQVTALSQQNTVVLTTISGMDRVVALARQVAQESGADVCVSASAGAVAATVSDTDVSVLHECVVSDELRAAVQECVDSLGLGVEWKGAYHGVVSGLGADPGLWQELSQVVRVVPLPGEPDRCVIVSPEASVEAAVQACVGDVWDEVLVCAADASEAGALARAGHRVAVVSAPVVVLREAAQWCDRPDKDGIINFLDKHFITPESV
ncbi:lysophospholipid acyltransferase family protein [Corynebacterium diphtheriae]|uniref:lysophospholipid acyltransferase family protein n=1 Tax=Corynebacterium diphtheriae TaxID=1717 RepID=UPI000316977F|nr:lysophospholipid acyltransferase family protein [Corynebacterium diphtheriae]OJI01557.1 1-acyl-sn-glycerol-3-phosphate acyltransferase [Corynebacterium diphtheriae]VEJ66515.1 putative acyltransferase [Corynebacterium diphtheriae]